MQAEEADLERMRKKVADFGKRRRRSRTAYDDDESEGTTDADSESERITQQEALDEKRKKLQTPEYRKQTANSRRMSIDGKGGKRGSKSSFS